MKPEAVTVESSTKAAIPGPADVGARTDTITVSGTPDNEIETALEASPDERVSDPIAAPVVTDPGVVPGSTAMFFSVNGNWHSKNGVPAGGVVQIVR